MQDADEQLAQAVAVSMYEKDEAARLLGIHVCETAPDFSICEMKVKKNMLNGHQTCHGGMIFTLADTAFAYACNSRNILTVAAGCDISFLAPAFLGDTLKATANEQHQSGRSGIYDVRIENQDGVTIALFRGRSHSFRDKSVIPQDEQEQ